MSTKIKPEREREVVSNTTELWIGLCRVMSSMLSQLSNDDQSDMLELLREMSGAQTDEELVEAEITIREILEPKSGVLSPMILPQAARPDRVQKWADFCGKRIRETRKDQNLTQEQLAQKAGLPQPHISRIENGEISPNHLTVEKIAKALGMPAAYFDPSDSYSKPDLSASG